MSEELRPCPFCGSYHVRVCTIPTGYKHNPRVWYVKCDDCESKGSRVFDKSEAITRWNIRIERTCLMEWNAPMERTCECVAEYAKSPIDGKTIVLHRCSACHELMRPHMNYCPHCGAKVIEEKGKGNDGE